MNLEYIQFIDIFWNIFKETLKDKMFKRENNVYK